MSMISKQIETLRKYALTPGFVRKSEIKEIYTEAADTIETLSAKIRANNLYGGWIPVSEELPDTSVYVLASTKDNDVMNAIIREDYNGEKYWFHRREELPKGFIIAWMPLPEPYKGGDMR